MMMSSKRKRAFVSIGSSGTSEIGSKSRGRSSLVGPQSEDQSDSTWFFFSVLIAWIFSRPEGRHWRTPRRPASSAAAAAAASW